jgi:subtilisin family serine protease
LIYYQWLAAGFMNVTKFFDLARIGLAVFVGLICATARPAVPASPAADYVEGEVLVRFQTSNTLTVAQQVAARHGLILHRHFDWLSRHEGRVVGLLRSPKLSTVALLKELQAEPAIAFAEPNYLRYTTDLPTPNDAKFKFLWGLRNAGQAVNGLNGTANADIGFLRAWGLAQSATNEIVVGIIDTGLDVTHPDLVSNLWINPGEISGNGLDDDGNGYVDDVHGYDFALGTGTLTDSGFHGTHVAGTVAATGNNGIGVIGVDFQAHLMGLKVSDNGSNMASAAVIEAIQYATMMKTRGINVVALNASYGGSSYSSTERSAMLAAGDAGIIFCVAAGNETNNNNKTSFYPASYRLTNMIVVAASDQNDTLANFSNYGSTTVDLAAPGVNILSCSPVSQPGYNTYIQQSNSVISGNAITFSGATSSNGFSGTIYYCGLGYPTNFPAAVSNNIALIQRGTLYFSEKVTNAMAAGASAVIVFNNTNGNFNGTLGAAGNWIPAISISQADGQALQSTLPATGTVFNYLDPAQIYQILDGTSMATPHVSGAVAFAAMNFPADSVPQRIQRILAGVTPVPALAGKTITGGRLNLARIVNPNETPPGWPTITSQPLSCTNRTGDTVSIGVTADGTTPMSYHWRRNGVKLTNGGRISGVTNNLLTIAGVLTNDAGSYSVVITNNYNSVTSRVAVLTVFLSLSDLPVTIAGQGTLKPGYNNTALVTGQTYTMTAKPAKGYGFSNWTAQVNGTVIFSTNKTALTFVMQSNLTLTATFVDVTKPVLKITAPKAKQKWTNEAFTVAGTVKDNGPVAVVNCQLNGGVWTNASTINGWTNWTAGVTLVPGTNTIRAYAVDAGGNRSLTNNVVMTCTKPSALVANRGTPSTIAKSAVTPNPPLQFGSISVSADVRQVKLTGPADAVVVIESSPDLVHWTAIQTNTMVGEEITVTVPMSQLPSQFVRARTQ